MWSGSREGVWCDRRLASRAREGYTTGMKGQACCAMVLTRSDDMQVNGLPNAGRAYAFDLRHGASASQKAVVLQAQEPSMGGQFGRGGVTALGEHRIVVGSPDEMVGGPCDAALLHGALLVMWARTPSGCARHEGSACEGADGCARVAVKECGALGD